jgi:hypothetical protein
VNAAPLVASAGGLGWEDLQATSGHPIDAYKVYRAGDPSGLFLCARQGSDPEWPGGDPQDPGPGAGFYYLVTAVNAAGQETRPGNRSDGIPRTVDTSSACPP